MSGFFRFPHTSHLAWLGEGKPREDKVLVPAEAEALLIHEVVVEEKVDGANVGFSLDEAGVLQVQNRGSILAEDACHAQFRPLFRWLAPRRERLAEALFPDLMLFGEWCRAVHSVRYARLPDWFLAFDVYDRAGATFWSTGRRDAWLRDLDLVPVPRLGRGRFDLSELRTLLGTSRLGGAPAEGLYVRYDEGDHLVMRAKLVRPEFVQAIQEHWSRKPLQANRLAVETRPTVETRPAMETRP